MLTKANSRVVAQSHPEPKITMWIFELYALLYALTFQQSRNRCGTQYSSNQHWEQSFPCLSELIIPVIDKNSSAWEKVAKFRHLLGKGRAACATREHGNGG